MRRSVLQSRGPALVLALAALVALPVAANAAGVARVKVGPYNPRVYGVLLSANAGDRACYLHMKDDKGVAFEEMADFDLCEPAFVKKARGKRLALTYGIANVLAADCDGDMDCGRSDKVALVEKARILQSAKRRK